jgi:hypothetical protein
MKAEVEEKEAKSFEDQLFTELSTIVDKIYMPLATMASALLTSLGGEGLGKQSYPD